MAVTLVMSYVPADPSEPTSEEQPTPTDPAKSAALAAIDTLVAQRDRAEHEHTVMLAGLLAVARALNCPPSKQACLDKVVELYQEIDHLKSALADALAPQDAAPHLRALP